MKSMVWVQYWTTKLFGKGILAHWNCASAGVTVSGCKRNTCCFLLCVCTLKRDNKGTQRIWHWKQRRDIWAWFCKLNQPYKLVHSLTHLFVLFPLLLSQRGCLFWLCLVFLTWFPFPLQVCLVTVWMITEMREKLQIVASLSAIGF